MEKTNKLLLLIPFSIVLAGALIAGSFFYINKNKTPKETVIPPQEAAQKALNFINQNLLEGLTATLTGVTEENGLYKLKLTINNQEYTSYVSKNGKFLFPGEGIDIEKSLTQTGKATPTQEIQKTDKPDVKLFVMSYCPYGLQMEKAILPVWQLLKDKADIGIYFVDYLMHGKQEMEENLRQYCIQKEQKEKYLAYLGCFVKDGKFENCLKETQIDEGKLKSCIESTDKEFKISENFKEGYPPFDVHKDLNEKYGVRGSPTLVVNDVVVNVERSPEKVKEAICNAFLNPPSECQQKLSETPASISFGLETGSSSGGQCK